MIYIGSARDARRSNIGTSGPNVGSGVMYSQPPAAPCSALLCLLRLPPPQMAVRSTSKTLIPCSSACPPEDAPLSSSLSTKDLE